MEEKNWQEVLLEIWQTIVSWFEVATGWLDPLLKPTTDQWWVSGFDYFNTFPVLLQILFVGILGLLILMGLFSLIKKSLKIVVVVGIIVLVFMVLNG
ncbi:Uncharacterised protein [Acholeplasma oculi]|uniref:Uncharacterized protein n=1 Tax=Acholeplasma oculi TaxID=35623 RepID=A0A061AAG6_9MOLU|nr:hypothetical protein [Acholeplasma oculi]CDR30828.1 hypothetical protein Aocu_07550 [Acholeplasma oculi]SKC35165.1 hypothetical protein SAMN02745122_0180 [Acholeplasma oculi]SUT89852.1 Uncharacterised protein [Acholeplasma oculi]